MKHAFVCMTALAWACASLAFADTIVDQVERLEIESGEAEFELQSVYAKATDGEPSALTLEIQGEYGVSDALEIGFELGALREGSENLDIEAFALQAKFVALDPAEAIIGFGAQVSIGHDFDEDATEAELRLLAETRVGALSIAGDVQFERMLDGDDEEVAILYSARADWSHSWGAIGLEAGGDLQSEEETRAWIGPVATLNTSAAVLEFSLFAPLTDATPDMQGRVVFRLAL